MTKPFKIGSLEIKSNFLVAPMAGISDTAFRNIIRELSPHSLLISEMLSSEALKWSKDRKKAGFSLQEHPISLQISGHKEEILCSVAQELEEMGADVIDLNMGCPMPKIVKNGDGCAMLKDLDKASNIIKAVSKAISIPVTVKYRIGWDEKTLNYLDFGQMCQDSGAKAVTVHGRTRAQLYTGMANWEAITEIANTLKIPVIGNGDVTSPQLAVQRLHESGCAAIAIGRGALGNPWMIPESEHLLKTGYLPSPPSMVDRLNMALRHCKDIIAYMGEEAGIKYSRKIYPWYIKGIPHASHYRYELINAASYKEIEVLLSRIKDDILLEVA